MVSALRLLRTAQILRGRKVDGEALYCPTPSTPFGAAGPAEPFARTGAGVWRRRCIGVRAFRRPRAVEPRRWLHALHYPAGGRVGAIRSDQHLPGRARTDAREPMERGA